MTFAIPITKVLILPRLAMKIPRGIPTIAAKITP
ncbi:Uncharacterised protein [Listeria monocytogenes]|nr:Uncharacterised protein [Listeria monocytogenes]